ncbi:hypothetical protein GCM10010468_24940 [Actinocorallia longicatena]|uniref:Uncharacterized protein n=1 Tax=Actinocorallia longicatena TaxID=111803 RepID=A0ABP6QCT2_9ACTN
MAVYAFDFGNRYRHLLRLAGVRPGNSRVTVDDETFRVEFGRWGLRTPLVNIASARETGPYRAWRAIGVRLALTDTGLTFGSATRGVCVTFKEPVRGFGPRRNATVTVTVADPAALTAWLNAAITD